MDSCDHPVQVAGLCAVCGKTVDEWVCYAPRDRGSSSQLHDISGVKVSTAEATRLDSESTRHLLSQRKLALIVDLDQTIIHATVDPTVGEWMKDGGNPNHNALADVGKFFLGVDGKAVVDPAATQASPDAEQGNSDGSKHAPEEAHGDGCWYYVKPRPGLQQFLQDLSRKFEMHVYTMGTRTYAESVCKLVDPHGTIFGARIISRDENGSLVQKSLKKLFPMDTSMVVIIDDRADVWQWSPNLVRVSPFDFFVGIGDINATFLPKQSAATSVAPAAAATQTNDDSDTTYDSITDEADESPSSIGESSESSGPHSVGAASQQRTQNELDNDDAAKSAAAESQKTAVNEQIDARPLAKMQQALDGQTVINQGHTGNIEIETDSSVPSSSAASEVAAVLREDDRELVRLQNILDDIHSRWYRVWDLRRADDDDKPAITGIIAAIKHRVLSGCHIVFSSIAPLHQDLASTEFWRMAMEFGATCSIAVDTNTTHVVAAKSGTEKVLVAQRRGLHAVWSSWLLDSCLHWIRLPEEHYALPLPTRMKPSAPEESSHNGSEDEATEDEEGNDDQSPSGNDGDTDEGFGEMNWDEANDEIDEVLAGLSDDDEDDDESSTDVESLSRRSQHQGDTLPSSSIAQASAKRARESESGMSAPDGSASAHDDESDLTLSPLSKRRRMAEIRAGQSKLKESVTQVEGDRGEGTLADKSEKYVATSTTAVPDISKDEDSLSTAGAEDDFLQSLEAELHLQLDGADDGSRPATAVASPLSD